MALGMTKNLLKNLFSRPATLMYPKTAAKKFPATRGHLENDMDRCILCGSCQRKCPCVAIQVDRLARKWELDVFRCISCGCCVEACPVKCLRMDTSYTAPTTEHAMKVTMKKELPAATPAPAQATVKKAKAKPKPWKRKAAKPAKRGRPKKKK
jgi:formate hydrogenlyase subunit 6/NADH:ubiquinone oxidoreductase subunit I